MSTCLKPQGAVNWETCLRALAAGWILPDDMCAVCTHRFICALSAIEDLNWHPEFKERARTPPAGSERVQ